MELTVDQALKQGVAAHKEGKLQEAERLYLAILKVQPTHPDANHHLGVLAVSANKAEAALPLFKAALETNPKIEQFWLSYIDALMKEKQFDTVKQVIEQGRNQGISAKKLDTYEFQLAALTPAGESKHIKGKKAFSEKRKKLAAEKRKKAQKQGVKVRTPSKTDLVNLLQHYQAGRFSDAEKLALSLIQEFPEHQFGWKVLGSVLKETGRISESLIAKQKAVELDFQDAEAHSNLGNMLKELGRLEEAEASYRQAIALKPDLAKAHYNLGSTLKELGRLDEVEAHYRQAIALKSNYVEAHSNLGNMLKELGRLEESEASYRQAIALKPDFAEAHSNLGVTLEELGRLEEAEASYRQAIALKPDFAETHINLGITLQELGRLEEAEASLRQAIALKSDYAEAHHQLGIILYINGGKDSALKSIKKAHDIGSKSKDVELLLAVLKSRKSSEKSGVKVGDLSNPVNLAVLIPNRLILNRVVEAELIANLYEISSRELDKTKDSRFGNGACSLDFNLFKDTRPIIKTVAEDLTRIMTEAVKSEIYIYDSFFNILGAGGGTTPHHHLNKLDKIKAINLGKKKYSLVYYLSEGDQNCSEPGILKLYDPSEDILPYEGMIAIMSGSRQHSAIYGGKKDRVMIGVNFYSL